MQTDAIGSAEQNESSTGNPMAAAASASSLVTDAVGIPLQSSMMSVFGAQADYQEAKDLYDRLAQLIDHIAQGPGGQVYRQDLVRTMDNGRPAFACPGLRVSLGKLHAAEPYCGYCPSCHVAHPGRTNPRCRTCGGRGWTTHAACESCPERTHTNFVSLKS